jgi:RecG-like helicase
MTEYGISDYYSSRLTKMGFDFYQFITYLPFRLEVISPNLNEKADTYFITGRISKVLEKGKYNLVTFITNSGEISLFDFSKKTKYLKDLTFSNQYQAIMTMNNEYYNLVDLSPLKAILGDVYELGKLKQIKYYKPVYTLINYQIRSKQINNIHQNIKPQFYLLNLIGLVPENSLIPQIINLEPIHKPKSLNEYNQALTNWHNFNAFLNLVFINHLDDYKPNKDTLINPYPERFVEEFEQKINIHLSPSQKIAIEAILDKITYKK